MKGNDSALCAFMQNKYQFPSPACGRGWREAPGEGKKENCASRKNKQKRRRRGMLGVTLLSCLLALVLIAGLAFLASPMLAWLFTKTHSSSYQALLLSEINFARLTALTRHMPVTLCASASGRQCDGSWSDGQLMVMNDQPLRVFSTRAEGLLTFSGFGSSQSIIFDSASDIFVQNGTFTYTPQNSNTPTWQIIINTAGRARVVDYD